MSRIVKFSFIIVLVAVVFHSQEGFAMGRHVHFVDSNYEGKAIKGQPVGEKGTRFEYETSNYSVFINYPADHRVKWPLKQRMTLQVGNYPPVEVTFKVIHWKLIDQNGREIPLKYGITDRGDFLQKEFVANDIPLDFFSDIPGDINQLTLEFKIEIKTPSGVEILEKKIPLKRAYFKTTFSEIFWRHERW